MFIPTRVLLFPFLFVVLEKVRVRKVRASTCKKLIIEVVHARVLILTNRNMEVLGMGGAADLFVKHECLNNF